MNKLEYIPGDLVYFGKKTVKVEFQNPSSDNTMLVKNIEDKDGDKVWNVYIKEEICPIPITIEILKKNGWKRKNEYEVFSKAIHGTTTGRIEPYKIITVWLAIDDLNIWSVAVGNEDVVYIQYVHELQNFLFGLKLNSEIEV